jgi:hypothetical protein
VNVKRRAERLGSLEDRPAARFVEINALGMRIHEKTVELESVNRSLHFPRGGLRILWREARQSSEPLGVTAHGFAQTVVG